MRKSWRPLDLVILNKLTFPFFGSYVCDDQYPEISHIDLKKKHTHTFAVSGKIVVRGATLNSPAIYSSVYTMKHGVKVQFLKT